MGGYKCGTRAKWGVRAGKTWIKPDVASAGSDEVDRLTRYPEIASSRFLFDDDSPS